MVVEYYYNSGSACIVVAVDVLSVVFEALLWSFDGSCGLVVMVVMRRVESSSCACFSFLVLFVVT